MDRNQNFGGRGFSTGCRRVFPILVFISTTIGGCGEAPNASASNPYTEKIAGSEIKFDMVPIPGGKFTMGSPASETDRKPDEGPEREITIRPFYMGKCEVTWDEYDLWVFDEKTRMAAKDGNEPDYDALTRPTPAYTDMTFKMGHDGYPAISMTHHAAMEYCRWLTARTGKLYRLPTEAEWEYACRAGSKSTYNFGDDASKIGDYAWFKGNAEKKYHQVGQKKPNAWGLHDMHGNIAEWCLDVYDKSFYEKSKQTDPKLAPVFIPTKEKYPNVARGGSWKDDPKDLRSAARRASRESWSDQDPQLPQSIWWHSDAQFVGFRVIHPIEEQENLKGLRSQVRKNED